MPEGVDSVTPPQKGDNVYSTINKEIQVKTENAIMDQLRWLHTHAVSGKTHPYAKTGFAVAMEVDTGNVVAMASMPDYDANYWQTGTISTDKYKEIEHVYQNATIKNVGSGNLDNTLILLYFSDQLLNRCPFLLDWKKDCLQQIRTIKIQERLISDVTTPHGCATHLVMCTVQWTRQPLFAIPPMPLWSIWLANAYITNTSTMPQKTRALTYGIVI